MSGSVFGGKTNIKQKRLRGVLNTLLKTYSSQLPWEGQINKEKTSSEESKWKAVPLLEQGDIKATNIVVDLSVQHN